MAKALRLRRWAVVGMSGGLVLFVGMVALGVLGFAVAESAKMPVSFVTTLSWGLGASMRWFHGRYLLGDEEARFYRTPLEVWTLADRAFRTAVLRWPSPRTKKDERPRGQTR